MEAIMNVKPHYRPQQLQKLYRSETNARLARRIQGVYLASKGLTCPQIMEITGSARRTIQQWVAKYNTGAIEALKDSPRSGAPTKLSQKQQQAFCKRIEAGQTKQDRVSVLNGPAIKKILEQEFGVSYSLWGVYRLLHRLRFSCLCPRPQHEEVNPQAQEEFKKSSLKHWIRSNQSIRTKK
jgi:transposase